MTQKTELTDLASLYEQLEAEAEAAPPQERRRHPRTRAKGHVPATLELAGVTGKLPVAIRDMSRTGIGLFVSRPIREGESVVVGFRLRAGPVRATCRVVNCRKDESGRYVVGLAMAGVCRTPSTAAANDVPSAAPPQPPGEPEGDVLSAAEVMEGADTGTVDEVVRRLAEAMAEP